MDTFQRQTAICLTGRVVPQDLTGEMFGANKNRSFKRGICLAKVFVRQGSTVTLKYSIHG